MNHLRIGGILCMLRLPFLALLAALLMYWSAADAARVERQMGLQGPFVAELSVADSGQDPDQAASASHAWATMVNSLPRTGCRAVFVPDDEVGVGIGVYDPDLRWHGLPFTQADYAGPRRAVSVRDDSALATFGETAKSSTRADSFLAPFSERGTPPRADFVYPLGSATSSSGTLWLEGPDQQALDGAVLALTEAGLVVDVQTDPPLVAQLATSPFSVAMIIIAGLAWLSTTASWAGRVRFFLPALRTSVRLGATPLRASLVATLVAGIAWAAAFSIVIGLMTIVWRYSELRVPEWLWPVGLGLFAADLVVAVGTVLVRCVHLARLREP